MVSGSGQARPRASTVVTIAIVNSQPYSLAAVLTSGEPERLYSALSVLVSTAGDGGRCAALASFRALDLLPDDDLLQRAGDPEATPSLSWAGRDTFARSLSELRDTALGLESLDIYACAASVETMTITPATVEERLDGVMSTPRFLREARGAALIFV
jgi:peroxiredoxin family protein